VGSFELPQFAQRTSGPAYNKWFCLLLSASHVILAFDLHRPQLSATSESWLALCA
jgi:hypothetical protein